MSPCAGTSCEFPQDFLVLSSFAHIQTEVDSGVLPAWLRSHSLGCWEVLPDLALHALLSLTGLGLTVLILLS